MSFDLNKLVRKNIRDLKPYSSARSEFSGVANVFLDANENSFGSPLTKWYNRYPDPLQWELKKKIATIKNVKADQILLGNGSDECIDLLIRAFCEPQLDNIIICPPTYGMYEVYAHINNVKVKEVNLQSGFQLNLEGIESAIDEFTRIIFLCSPNNPTGNSLLIDDMEMIINNFDGLVVVDEAYINFSRQKSLLSSLDDYPNLVVMQTFSKAWGLAALRLGMVMASAELVDVLNKIKPPYNINQATQEIAISALDHLDEVNVMIKEIVNQRSQLAIDLAALQQVIKIYPSDANFILVKVTNATALYQYLKEKGIIVRNRSNVILCDDCLRITVGTPGENKKLLEAIKSYGE